MSQYVIPDTVDYLSDSMGESVLKQIQYVRSERPDVMEQLIRDCSPEHLMYKLKSQYVFPSTLAKSSEQSELDQAVLLVFLCSMEALPESLVYLDRLVTEVDMCIITYSADIYELVTQKYGSTQNRCLVYLWTGNQDWNMLREVVRSYSYICAVHDMPYSLRGMHGRITQTESWIIWDNLLKSSEYLHNIVMAFCEDPYLGVLLPPKSMHSRFTGNVGDSIQSVSQPEMDWFGQFVESRNTCCWCRAEIFEKFIFGEESKKYPDIAKELGYITGTVMSDMSGGIQATALDTLLRQCVKSSWTLAYEIFGDYLKNDTTAWTIDFWSFFVDHPSVMVYGTGGGAESLRPYFEAAAKKIDGYIVSDGCRTENCHDGVRVYELSEVTPYDGLGIIVAMLPENSYQVLPALKNRGFDVFVCANAENQESASGSRGSAQ